jgi:hypothetical protein
MFSKNILLVALLYISFGLVSAFNFKNIIFGGESEHVETKDSASFGRDLPLTTRSTRPGKWTRIQLVLCHEKQIS